MNANYIYGPNKEQLQLSLGAFAAQIHKSLNLPEVLFPFEEAILMAFLQLRFNNTSPFLIKTFENPTFDNWALIYNDMEVIIAGETVGGYCLYFMDYDSIEYWKDTLIKCAEENATFYGRVAY